MPITVGPLLLLSYLSQALLHQKSLEGVGCPEMTTTIAEPNTHEGQGQR